MIGGPIITYRAAGFKSIPDFGRSSPLFRNEERVGRERHANNLKAFAMPNC